MRLNQSLALAYYLKEDRRPFWEQPSKTTAAAFLEDRLARAQNAGIPFLPSSRLSRRPWHGIAAVFWPMTITRSSIGPLEGATNKIKTMQRQA